MSKELGEMTRKDFEAVPQLQDWAEEVTDFDSLVILPSRRIHDSGYRCMYFVACSRGKPIVKIAGGSDVIHLDGIGGYGYKWMQKNNGVPGMVEAKGWSIDCLKKSGLLRIFTHGKLIAGSVLSSFEIFSESIKKQ